MVIDVNIKHEETMALASIILGAEALTRAYERLRRVAREDLTQELRSSFEAIGNVKSKLGIELGEYV